MMFEEFGMICEVEEGRNRFNFRLQNIYQIKNAHKLVSVYPPCFGAAFDF